MVEIQAAVPLAVVETGATEVALAAVVQMGATMVTVVGVESELRTSTALLQYAPE